MSEDRRNKSKQNRGNTARPVADIIGKVMAAVMARRSGMTVALINAWDEIASDEFRPTTKPEKIDWPRRSNESDPFEPGVLVVACDGSAALFFQHEQAAILERVNLFFGFEAIKRIRILQKPVYAAAKEKPEPVKVLSKDDERHLNDMLVDIDNETLKKTMMKLGRGVIAQSR